MSRRSKVVVGAPGASDDDLLLPRPPGVLRRFWARHPLAVDILVALGALFFSLPATAVRADTPTPTTAEIWFAIAMVALGCAALLWRRRRPLAVFVVAAVPSFVLSPSLVPTGHVLLAFALYAIAVYRSSRACWVAFGVSGAGLAIYGTVTYFAQSILPVYSLTGAISGIVTLLIAALIGVNVGGRRRYLAALIDRSRQLLVERDQQAQLAAAAERTRIAREMHDIVSHSLTVVVALSEGAAAASENERAQQASRGAADTARAALTEMRAMLGVLRDGTEESSPLEPLEPVEPARVVEAAQRAGVPATLETRGAAVALSRTLRFALGRLVQEGTTNAMRHAPDATYVRIRVTTDSDRVILDIHNDGVAASSPAPGYGLRGLRERVERAGGTFEAGAVGAREWMLRAELPLIPDPGEETP